MAQITTGVRSILSVPGIYDAIQTALGAYDARKVLVKDYIRAVPGQKLIDVGCGTGELLPHLPAGVGYVGFDLSPDYIRQARERHAAKGRFECMDVADFAQAEGFENADVVVAVGLLHHLDDDQACQLLRAISRTLRAGGRLVTMDPTFLDRQSAVATFILKRDRGQNIRTPTEYIGLTKGVFSSVESAVREDLLRIPYSHCILECTR